MDADGFQLSEGIGDIFAVYFGNICEGNSVTEWIIGEDATNGAVRNIANPRNDLKCWDGTRGNNETFHDYGTALSYLFYLISDGPHSTGIGIDKAMMLILDATRMSSISDDYKDFMNTMVELIINEEGFCSDAHKSLVAAFEEICIPVPGNQKCNLAISGITEICEESNSLNLSVANWNTGTNEEYNWSFPNWVVEPGNGNGTNASQFLKISQFSPYPYYPQFIDVCVQGLTTGFRKCVKVRLNDCNNSSPTCEEFHFQFTSIFPKTSQDLPATEMGSFEGIRDENDVDSKSNDLGSYIKLFDILGNSLYEGFVQNLDQTDNRIRNKILIMATYDKSGELISVEKNVVLD